MIVALLLSSSAARADEWAEAYKQGQKALIRGDWDSAIQFFQRAIDIRRHSDSHAVTITPVEGVEYLPYYYLAQAYFHSGKPDGMKLALVNLEAERNEGEVQKTEHRNHFNSLERIARQLIPLPPPPPLPVDREVLSRILAMINRKDCAQATQAIDELIARFPADSTLHAVEEWVRASCKAAPEPPPPSVSAESHFENGLKHFLRNEYTDARAQFQLAQETESNPFAADWIRRTDYEINRLNPGPIIHVDPILTPSEPVVLINAPEKTTSTTVELVGKVHVSEGPLIDRVEFTLNGAPILDSSGVRRRAIRPRSHQEDRDLSFSTLIPLRTGPNQIVVTAYPDSTGHPRNEYLTITRQEVWWLKYLKVTLAATALLAIATLLIAKAIKYRIAFVNKYNPYIAGSPILNEKMLFGREKLLKRIMNTVHNNSLLLYGPRRIGKTSLQHELKRRLESLNDPEFLYIPVLIDLQGTSEQRFFRTVMEDVVEVCRPRIPDGSTLSLHVQDPKSEYFGREFSRDLKNLIDALKATTAKQLKLVLLLDEVDVLNTYSDHVNQKLRSVFMKTFADNLVAVMSGSYIKKEWASEGSPWYNFFEEIEVPPLEREAASDLIREPVRGIFRYDPKAILSILEYSEGKPYLIQRFCIHVVNRIIENKRRRVTAADVEAVRDQVLHRSEPVGATSAERI
jgi:hypothetical protein